MKVVLIDAHNREEYEQILSQSVGSSVNQSLWWGLAQERVGRESIGLVVVGDNGSVLGSALITKHVFPFGYTYLYVNRGPLFDPTMPEVFDLIMGHVDEMAKAFKSVFVRVDPYFVAEQECINSRDKEMALNNFGYSASEDFFSSRGFVSAHATYQPNDTLILDITQSEDDLLANMKPKGRYNIKVAQKKGVTCTAYWDDGEAVDAFVDMLQKTAKRDGFAVHPALYYKTLMETLGPRKQCVLLLAEHEGKVVAGALQTFYGHTATYYYGASDHASRSLMAPYLLQWEMIRLAKQMRCRFYDFLGVAPRGDDKHRFANITAFKEKFGGHRLKFVGSWEKVYKPLVYWGVIIAKRMRGLLRR